MKTLKALALAALLCGAVTALAVLPSGQVTIAWFYPTNAVTPDLYFVITATNSFSGPLTNWPTVAVISATNSVASISGTNYLFTAPFQMQPGQMFFTGYASNFWGMSSNSNVAQTPSLPLPLYQSITRTN